MNSYNFFFTLPAILFNLICSGVCMEFVEYQGTFGLPGNGINILLISGEEEYRSEEALPMLGKILAGRHGFNCRVIFAIDPQSGEINPNYLSNLPGIDALDSANLMILYTRFRNLPDEQMKYIIDYSNSGKPIIGLRTATHPFKYESNSNSPYKKYGVDDPSGGYGKIVFGETWVSHHGTHGIQSTQGLVVVDKKNHPAMRGVAGIWGPSNVYGINALPENAEILVHGQVLDGMKADDPPVDIKGLKPLIWTRKYIGEDGDTSTILMSTIGAAVDFQSEGLRRVIINSSYWMTGFETLITDSLNISYVDGPYNPSFFGFGSFRQGVIPDNHEMIEVFESLSILPKKDRPSVTHLNFRMYNVLGQKVCTRISRIWNSIGTTDW